MLRPLAFALALGPTAVHAACTHDAMLVFDGSASMGELGFDGEVRRREDGSVDRRSLLGQRRIDEARTALARTLPAVDGIRRVGLLTYGPGPEGSCESIRLRFAPIDAPSGPVLDAIDRFQPLGMTPLADAVEAGAEALSYRERPAVVVLLTDGNDTCGGAPCVRGARLAAEARDLTIHVIGFGRTQETAAGDPLARGRGLDESEIRCLSDATGGIFAIADTVDDLTAALGETLGCPVVGHGRARPGREAG